LLLHFRIAQLLPAGLDGKIGLALRYGFLAWIGFLDDEIYWHALGFVVSGAAFLADRQDARRSRQPRRPSSFSQILMRGSISGVTRHHQVLRRRSPSFADFDHIGDVNEMILHPLAAVETSGSGGLDDGLEIPVIRVAKNLGKVPAGPEFIARRVGAADLLKRGDVVIHKSIRFSQMPFFVFVNRPSSLTMVFRTHCDVAGLNASDVAGGLGVANALQAEAVAHEHVVPSLVLVGAADQPVLDRGVAHGSVLREYSPWMTSQWPPFLGPMRLRRPEAFRPAM